VLAKVRLEQDFEKVITTRKTDKFIL
jgi:hypothetical protein